MNVGASLNQTRSRWWIVAAVGVVALVAFGLRYGTNVTHLPPFWDEPYIQRAVNDILENGWAERTMLDFQETKGPAFVWTYAAIGELLGGDIEALRLMTVLLFVFSAVPLALMARRCGLDGPRMVLAAFLYALLPHNAVLSQLVMSEPSFIFGASWMVLSLTRSLGQSLESERRITGPVIFGLLAAILLHHRVHAAAMIAAVLIIAYQRDRWQSWPWFVAAALAGLSRVPLWIRWGGLVSPDFQDRFGLGVRFESLTYLGAAMVPYTAILLWPALTSPACRPHRWWIGVGAFVGLVLGVFAQPNLSLTHEVRYQGIISTLILKCSDSLSVQHAMMTVLAMIGVASLAALMVLAYETPLITALSVVERFTAWTLLIGWCMYALTYGYVFDRYLLIWAMLLPIVWVRTVPPWLLTIHALGLLAVVARLVSAWLMYPNAAT